MIKEQDRPTACTAAWARAAGRRAATTAAAAIAAVLITACGSSSTNTASAPGALRIVATENFWGSIATQLAGTKSSVQSIIVDPAQDPHSYEPKPADARVLSTARLVIVNGIGYDPWAPKLLAASPDPSRLTLTVGDLLGLKEGDNPHRWYNPSDVETVAATITSDLKKLDPKDAAYFDQQNARFENQRLAQYHSLITMIKSRYAGVPVGASESIFAMLAPSLGLNLATPAGFMKSISEGTEVTAQDKIATEKQLSSRQIKVWVYNSQNATPEVQRLNALARANHIPITTVTETLQPARNSFEQWQVTQLQGLARALRQATGR
jgi:zinc/manganese transport system substrate-binding protein